MGFYHDKILPRLIHLACGNETIAACRAELLKDARGTVLEVGFGSGTNLAHYPKTLEKLFAVEPSATALILAQDAMNEVPYPVEVAGDDGQKLDLTGQSIDTVVFTFTLCTIPDIDAALAEAARVLKPGGQVLFIEHGLSDERGTARWQHRLNRLQMTLCGGCHLNRRMDEAIKRSPLRLTDLKTFYLAKTPKMHGFVYQGKAEKT